MKKTVETEIISEDKTKINDAKRDKTERIKELIDILNNASKAYYQLGSEIMTNFEYDEMYDELLKLEEETGIIFANSPTVNVGYDVLSSLPKENHQRPMLSLDKTKNIEELEAFLGDKEGVLSWKLDGLTVVLTYNEGKLIKAVTRGNGEVGEVITNNARTFKNIPLNIKYKKELVLRGEAIIKYSDFEEINKEIKDADAKYKNPRNLCAGSVRQLSNEVTASRNVHFYAFTLVTAEEMEFGNSLVNQFEFLREQGFEVVEYRLVTKDTVDEAVEYFAKKIVNYDLPSDGLVLIYDDIQYGLSLGSTAKFPRNGIAFKWKDEIVKTKLLEMEWSPSRTGLINPVAIFEPVEIEGTTVSRASVHNVSIVESLELGIGDEIEVYKANMIIPQIATNNTRSGNLEIPDTCPACGEKTNISMVNDVKSLYCVNSKCPAKFIKKFAHFASRNALNIDGLSEETLEKFIDRGFIKEYSDIYHLDRYEEQITTMVGFGRKSFDNIIKAVNDSRKVTLPKLIYGLGMLNVGLSNAKVICKHFNNDISAVISADKEELVNAEGVGEIIANTFTDYFANEENVNVLNRLLEELSIEAGPNVSDSPITDKTFVITGSVIHFNNRNEIKELIESLGGKVTGSVSAKTDYLINNDALSNSSKNKNAAKLGVPVITEEEFLKLIGR